MESILIAKAKRVVERISRFLSVRGRKIFAHFYLCVKLYGWNNKSRLLKTRTHKNSLKVVQDGGGESVR